MNALGRQPLPHEQQPVRLGEVGAVHEAFRLDTIGEAVNPLGGRPAVRGQVVSLGGVEAEDGVRAAASETQQARHDMGVQGAETRREMPALTRSARASAA